jgi:hypothetical protein
VKIEQESQLNARTDERGKTIDDEHRRLPRATKEEIQAALSKGRLVDQDGIPVLPRATREEIETALAQGRLVGETLIPLREAQNGRKNGH